MNLSRVKVGRGLLALGLFWNSNSFLFGDSLEVVPAQEAAMSKMMAQGISALIKSEFLKSGFAVRDAHAKHHGCVKAVFKVNEKLPESLRMGAFQEGKSYPTWIRYSNGSGKSQDDSVGDGRGMAIKLMGVNGEKLAHDERFTQDFLFINHPVFFVRNAAEYMDFQKAVKEGSITKFFFPGLNPANWRLHEMKIANSIQSKKVENLLTTRYWSMTPSLLKNRAVKYSVRPCSGVQIRSNRTKSPNYLRETMRDHLNVRGACFEFGVQFQKDAISMPVEDPTIEWEEKVSPFFKVATITIPAQRFETKEQMRFCENLSLNPWHSNLEHRPLGGINRVRREVYEAVSKTRHELNQEARIEPTGNEEFPNP